MIVYSATKQQFVKDVNSNVIHARITAELLRSLGRKVGKSELSSWRNSMQFMESVVNDDEIPDDAGVSIEFNIPLTNNRIDFILSGKDENQVETAVIIELKQWSEVSVTTKDAIVQTFLGGGIRDTNHPSYQAWSYAALIEDFVETVRKDSIKLIPCAYLHNLESGDAVNDPRYQVHLDKAPVFISKDAKKLNAFLRQFVKHGDSNDIMYRIEHGKIRPSKSLADSLSSMLQGNKEFLMIDHQKVVYETALDLVAKATKKVRQVLIVEGGPGTGKSVVAINLLVELPNRDKLALYVSKNAAPRAVYSEKLRGTKTRGQIDNLFKGSASFTGIDHGFFDALLIDESHRLNAKNRYNKDSENQVKELIAASKLSVFFIDEAQMVTWSDIGTKAEIRHWANFLGAEVQELRLESQFRCNGSDGYLAWIDDALQLHATANPTLAGVDYDFQVFDDPNEMRRVIRERNLETNKARMVAGYCWDWISDSRKKNNDPKSMDIVIPEHGFEARWNLANDGSLWITAGNSVNEVGCIHTCQGLELDYMGVIIGEDLIVRDGIVITDATKRSKTDASIKGYKKLFKEDSESALKKADTIIKNTYRTLMTRGQKGCYLFSVDPETNKYFKERAQAIGREPLKPTEQKYPGLELKIVDVPPSGHYKTGIPVLNLKAAAGDFSMEQFIEVCDWVSLPEPFEHKSGYFVAQVLGESMNKRIPNGSWCLFKPDQGGSRQGKIVLVQSSDIQDPETGGCFTIKTYNSEKKVEDDGTWSHERISLEPNSSVSGFKTIELVIDELIDFRVVGEFVAVI
jgi:DUF2075 family protein